ncbi:scaffolding protein [Mycobacterium phage Chargerpower]|nr:scaffolding protein [Mycobacterium phage Chargerpower]
MSDTATPEGTPAEGAPAAVVDPHKPEPKLYDEAYVKSLRDEAAAHRVAKKDAVEAAEKALKEAHAAELAARDVAYTELQNELGNAWIELEKLYVSIEAKVPSEKVRSFVEILQGSDKETIGESAKKNLDLFGGFETRSPAFDPTQGFGGKPKDLPLNGDPILAAVNAALGIS